MLTIYKFRIKNHISKTFVLQLNFVTRSRHTKVYSCVCNDEHDVKTLSLVVHTATKFVLLVATISFVVDGIILDFKKALILAARAMAVSQ